MKKKEKKKRLNVKKLICFLLIFYLFGCIIYNVYMMKIKHIVISGNYYLSDAEIIRTSGLKDYPSMFRVSKKKIKNKLSNLDLIDKVEVKKNLKFEIEIIVTEKKVICEYDNYYILSDNSKVKGNYIGTPTLINYVPEDILKRFLNNMSVLSYDIINSISEIMYYPSKDNEGNIIDGEIFYFKMNDGNDVIISIDKISLMNKYHKIYASLGDKKGILHLDKGDYLEVK